MSDIVFRRIHGRIVPIRKDGVSSHKKKQAIESMVVSGGKSAAATVLGTSVALYSGKFSAKVTHIAANIMNKQHDINKATEKAAKLATARSARKSAKVSSAQDAFGFVAKQTKIKFRPNLEKKLAEAAWSAKKSDALFKSRILIRASGAAIAGSLFGYAGVKGLEAITGKDASKSDIAKISEFAIPVAAGLVAASYYGRFIGAKAGIKKAFSMFKGGQFKLGL